MNKMIRYMRKQLNKMYKLFALLIGMLVFYIILILFDAIGHSIYYMAVGYQEPEVGAVCMVDRNNIQVLDTGEVIDLKTTAALIPEVRLMRKGEKYKLINNILIVKGGETDSLQYFIYDEKKNKAFCVLKKPFPNAQWLRKQYIFLNSIDEPELTLYFDYIENNKDWIYIQ
ncbi:MAG: hypothetical protein MSS75_03705 [Megasphaera sp.]|nr:hypothetical protein [Megasphaera sp.]